MGFQYGFAAVCCDKQIGLFELVKCRRKIARRPACKIDDYAALFRDKGKIFLSTLDFDASSHAAVYRLGISGF